MKLRGVIVFFCARRSGIFARTARKEECAVTEVGDVCDEGGLGTGVKVLEELWCHRFFSLLLRVYLFERLQDAGYKSVRFACVVVSWVVVIVVLKGCCQV